MKRDRTTSPQPLSKPVLLVGEGKEEVRFFSALLKHVGQDSVQVEDYGGKPGLGRYLKAQLVRSGFGCVERILITQDADDNPKGCFDSVCRSITACGLNPPANHAAISDGSSAIGVFIMPNGTGEGMLEDLCLASVDDDDVMKCVDQFIQCAQDCGQEPRPQAKARVQAWLATREAPGKRLGEAAEAGYWPWGHDAFGALVQFLTAAPAAK